jgi:heavy metal translocating P-type ATPase
LIDLVKAADEKQAPTQRIADKWATWLVPVALIIAIAAWLITGNIERGVTVLVVFCPCALILATPTAIMAAIGQATKYGVLIKSGEALETLGGLNTLVFDKTGTLTYGNLEVSDVISLKEDLTNLDLLKLTASCEKLSEHPLAKAIVNNAKEADIEIEEPQDFKMYPGKGVTCKNSYGQVYAGNSKFLSENEIDVKVDTQLNKLKNEGKASIIVALNGEVVGLIGLSDVIREDSKQMIDSLHEIGTETVLLTGDNTETANYFASQVGIGKVYGNLLPEEKLSWIEKFKSEGKKVCMIGDGVNDAPALKTANVSVAMGSVGSDVAIEAADIALLGDDIGKIPYLKKLSNSTLFTIKANIAISMTINAVAIVCSVLGLLNPVTGAIVHNAGSCLVVLNAALLYDRRFDDSIKKIDTQNTEHSHYHYHNDGEHSHSHEDVEILDEIETENGIKHIHVHKHSLNRQSCEPYHN